MKKTLTFLLAGALSVLLLSGCFLLKFLPGRGEPGENGQTDPVKDGLIPGMVGDIDLDGMSLDELLTYYDRFIKDGGEVLREGALYDLLYKGQTAAGDGAGAELGFDYPENALTAEFSDGEWETGRDFGELDVTLGMTADEKAAFESMKSALNDADAEDIKSQFEDVIRDIDGFEDFEMDTDLPGVSDRWPDSGIGRAVPDPGFPGMTVTASDGAVSAFSSGATADQAKAYVGKLRAAGFTENVSESEQTVAGYTIYSFSAWNSDGIYVALQHLQGTTTISVTKP